jgi:hypothetical protein
LETWRCIVYQEEKRKGKNKRHSERMKRWEAAKSVGQRENYFWVGKNGQKEGQRKLRERATSTVR